MIGPVSQKKLQREKMKFKVHSVELHGHIFTVDGKADPAKTEAIKTMPRPTNSKEVKRFLGMLNYLGKFIPNLWRNNSSESNK